MQLEVLELENVFLQYVTFHKLSMNFCFQFLLQKNKEKTGFSACEAE